MARQHVTEYQDERSAISNRIICIRGACSCGWVFHQMIDDAEGIAKAEQIVIAATVAHRNEATA